MEVPGKIPPAGSGRLISLEERVVMEGDLFWEEPVGGPKGTPELEVVYGGARKANGSASVDGDLR